MENEIDLGDNTVQVNKIIHLISYIIVPQTTTEETYCNKFITKINFIFPIISQSLLVVGHKKKEYGCRQFVVPNLNTFCLELSKLKKKQIKLVVNQSEIINHHRTSLNQGCWSFRGQKISRLTISELSWINRVCDKFCFRINFFEQFHWFNWCAVKFEQIVCGSKKSWFFRNMLAVEKTTATNILNSNLKGPMASDDSEGDSTTSNRDFKHPDTEEQNSRTSTATDGNEAIGSGENGTTSGGDKFKCLQCDKVYRKKRSLMFHSSAHHPGYCPICGVYSGPTPQEISDHNRKYHIKEFPHICEECGESFKRNQQFQIHCEVHKRKEEKANAAAVAAAAAATSSLNLKSPENKLEEKKPYKCSTCPMEFKILKAYEKHNHDCHKPDGYMCEQCGARYKERKSLLLHSAKYHNKKEMICKYCSKVFSYKPNLDRHVLLHTGQKKSFVCEECGLGYYSAPALKEHHDAVHKKAKEFICAICNKGFGMKRAWQRHQIVHSDERPYKCNYCDRTFKLKSNLVRHRHLTHKHPTQSAKLTRFVKNEKGELVPIEDNHEPVEAPQPKVVKKKSSKEKVTTSTSEPESETKTPTLGENNYIQMMNPEHIQYSTPAMGMPTTSQDINTMVNLDGGGIVAHQMNPTPNVYNNSYMGVNTGQHDHNIILNPADTHHHNTNQQHHHHHQPQQQFNTFYPQNNYHFPAMPASQEHCVWNNNKVVQPTHPHIQQQQQHHHQQQMDQIQHRGGVVQHPPQQHAMENNYSLIEVNSDALLSLQQIKSERDGGGAVSNIIHQERNGGGHQILDQNHYQQDIWNVSGGGGGGSVGGSVGGHQTHLDYTTPNMGDPNSGNVPVPTNTYNNIGSILTNLEVMDSYNGIGVGEMNMNFQPTSTDCTAVSNLQVDIGYHDGGGGGQQVLNHHTQLHQNQTLQHHNNPQTYQQHHQHQSPQPHHQHIRHHHQQQPQPQPPQQIHHHHQQPHYQNHNLQSQQQHHNFHPTDNLQQHQQHHQHHHQQQPDQNQINYDYNSQNHTITDISNTFAKSNGVLGGSVGGNVSVGPGPSTPSSLSSVRSNIVVNNHDTSITQINSVTSLDSNISTTNPYQSKQNTNENFMLPSLIDYLQHPYQF